MKIRKAILLDLTGIILFCSKKAEILGPEDPYLDKHYLRRQLTQAMKAKDSEVFIALTKNNIICGVLWAWIAGYAWNQQSYVTDIIFVADQGGNFLINKMEEWGKANHASRSTMQAHLTFKKGERVKNLYRRKGYDEVGAVFEKILRNTDNG